jgi:hypothetical protein
MSIFFVDVLAAQVYICEDCCGLTKTGLSAKVSPLEGFMAHSNEHPSTSSTATLTFLE